MSGRYIIGELELELHDNYGKQILWKSTTAYDGKGG